jgi:hypothetical protein
MNERYQRMTARAVSILCVAFIAASVAPSRASAQSGSRTYQRPATIDVIVRAGNFEIEKFFLDRNCNWRIGGEWGFYTHKYHACVEVLGAQMAPIDPERREWFGEQYSAEKYVECRKKAQPQETHCERHRLRRKEAPEFWPFHDKSPMKWPDPPKEPVYKKGMKPIDYWRALCKAEAGEFIYRVVEGVETIYQIRPRPREEPYAGGDRYVMEDPYGYVESESGSIKAIALNAIWPPETSHKSTPRFRALETPKLQDDIPLNLRKYYSASLFVPPKSNEPYQRFTGYSGDFRSLQMDHIQRISARYGWTWRGIRRPFDRELDVAGGELAVVDLRTGEVLGLRRGFVLAASSPDGRFGWGAGHCPEYSLMPGIGQIRKRNKDFDFSFWFIPKVVVPPHVMIDRRGR